jgi:hypothetical protein
MLPTMNWRTPMVLGLLAVELVLRIASAQEAQAVPAGIVLDGVTTILGDNRACFKVTFEDGRPEADFMLAEGQARYGIRLLAVDARSGTVTINEQRMYTRNISICKTPVLLAVTTSTTGVTAAARPGGNAHSGAVATDSVRSAGDETPAANGQFIPAAFAVGTGSSPSTGSENGTSGNSDNTTAKANNSDASSSAGAGDNTTQSHLYQWWIKEAEKIERARVETAQRVTAGEWPPYPLTPLTPPGTPAQLIGAGSLFMDHGPGVMIFSN